MNGFTGRLIILPALIFINHSFGQHKAVLEINEIEWNGVQANYSKPVLKYVKEFREESDVFYLDSFNGSRLFGHIKYLPIFNDTSDRPGYVFTIIDSNNLSMNISLPTDYKVGTYDAGYKIKDQHGTRRWVGKLKYTADTSIHLSRPAWRQDNYTLQVETFKAWNSKAHVRGNQANRVLKNLYFQGMTGEKPIMKSGGKYGDENFYLQVHPVRYQWGHEVWMEFTFKLYRMQGDGKYLQLLAHTFTSSDKNVIYNGNRKNNAYEIRDSQNEYYMLITGITIIPY